MKNVTMKRGLTVAVALTFGALAGWLQAAPVLVDGFETVPGSTDGTGDFDPLDNNNPHGTNTNGAVTESTPEGVQVRTDAVPPGPDEGSQYLRIAEGDAYTPFLSPEIVNTQDFTVTFSVYNSFGVGLNLQVGRINTADGPNIGFSNLRWEGSAIQRYQHISESPGPNYPWDTITTFEPGQWDRIGLEYQASGTALGTFNLYVNDFTTPVATDLLANNSEFTPPLNNLFLGTRPGAGEIFIDGIEVFEGPIPEPTPADIVMAEITDEFGLQFQSETGKVYSLEFTADLVNSNNYRKTGALVEGSGEIMELFDPAGFSTGKAYRVAFE